MDSLHIASAFSVLSLIVDVWSVSCCLVYDGTAAGTATSRWWFYLKLEEGKGMLMSNSSLFFCCWPIMAEV